MATAESEKRKGYASYLLTLLIRYARVNNKEIIRTRTKSGAEFYAKHGFDVVGKKGDDFLMEYKL